MLRFQLVSRRFRSFGEGQLHRLTDAEKIWGKLRVEEEFLPIQNVNVHVRFPQKRCLKSVTLPWRGVAASGTIRSGWVEVRFLKFSAMNSFIWIWPDEPP
jgi:hypothetical protein